MTDKTENVIAATFYLVFFSLTMFFLLWGLIALVHWMWRSS